MFKRFAILSLALLMLLSSSGYSISAHLCGGKAVSFSLFGRPADCGPGEEPEPADHCDHPVAHGEKSVRTHRCCSEKTVVVSGLELNATSVQKSFAVPVFVVPVAPGFHFAGLSGCSAAVKTRFSDYHQPARVRDLPVLLQVFRI
jgi:hypothetical protein